MIFVSDPVSASRVLWGGGDQMRLIVVTTNSILAEVLAEELNEIRHVEAEVVDIITVERDEFVPTEAQIVIVTEAAVGRWCRWRAKRGTPSECVEVIGALGSRWLLHESPESHGFRGSVDFKYPARDVVRELEGLRNGTASAAHEPVPCPETKPRGAVCHDSIDRRIAAYLTMGMSDREIGAKVHLSSQTVRNRVSRMLERSHVVNRTQLAMVCLNDPSVLRVQRGSETSTPRRDNIVR